MNNITLRTTLGTAALAMTLAGCGTMKTAQAPAAPAPVAKVAPAPAPVVAQAPAPAPAPKVFIIGDVNFDFDKSTLTAKGEETLNGVVTAMRDQPGIPYSVSGHTDSVGSVGYNQSLSERRANTVRDFQIKHGIPAGQLAARGYGEGSPMSSNETAAGRAENRRVEIRAIQ